MKLLCPRCGQYFQAERFRIYCDPLCRRREKEQRRKDREITGDQIEFLEDLPPNINIHKKGSLIVIGSKPNMSLDPPQANFRLDDNNTDTPTKP